MQSIMVLALAIFLLTYVLISVRDFKIFKVDRYLAALIGAGLMLVTGVVTPQEAWQAIDLGTLGLLLGMMLLVVALELCGFFSWVSIRLISRSRNQFQFLVLLMVVTAVLSALILNDTVVLIFTPIVIKVCQMIDANPVPFLVAEACAANIGSVATPVGNPQNAYIATQSGISFNQFFATLAPVAALSLLASIAIIWFVYRRQLMGPPGSKGNGPIRGSRPIDGQRALKELPLRPVHTSIYFVAAVLLLVFIGFVLSNWLGVSLAMIALLGGAVVLVALPFLNQSSGHAIMVRKVDWTLLLFFIGLFVLLKGLETSGVLDAMIDDFQSINDGGIASVAGLSAFTAILSNLISNVPAVILLAPFVAELNSEKMWLALASSSTLAGNATILGAAANVIVVEGARRQGVTVSFWQFVKGGFLVTVVTLLISIIVLEI
jgi:Na+/H+ antiporter NhaD/arsenite permease-like protein